jgi:ribonuclease HI
MAAATRAVSTPAATVPPGPAATAATVVYTDGACAGNPGRGGWAWAVPQGRFASGAAAQTTNQRMELTAALEAVTALDGPLEVVSDSTYLSNCVRDRWWEAWLRKGWVNRHKRPVANRDLWEPLVALVHCRAIVFGWVKGHSGDPVNELVDRLAVAAGRSQRGQHGVTLDALDGVDLPARPRRWPSGKR